KCSSEKTPPQKPALAAATGRPAPQSGRLSGIFQLDFAASPARNTVTLIRDESLCPQIFYAQTKTQRWEILPQKPALAAATGRPAPQSGRLSGIFQLDFAASPARNSVAPIRDEPLCPQTSHAQT